MDKIEKIKEWVKKQKKETLARNSIGVITGKAFFVDANELLSFLDTLSKEPDKSLEEAAEISFDEANALTEDYTNFLAKGLTENKPRPIGPHWFCEYAKNRFIAGAEWQKEQMEETYCPRSEKWKEVEETARHEYENGWKDCKERMMKEAVEGEYDFYPAAVYLDVPIPRMNHGDKVRVIIVKKEENDRATNAIL
ncbi:MAG: hypothetical protein J6T10_13005 [Methanobrevibacter sp.]|nr:hypothetical protein [Methanobrevibacter sp.]